VTFESSDVAREQNPRIQLFCQSALWLGFL
jgi:hypothetical protein